MRDFEDIVPIMDNNSDFDSVELDYNWLGRSENIFEGIGLTPHCIKHGAMNKVSTVYWRCLYPMCRSGCQEI